jgi:hypothetical protein
LAAVFLEGSNIIFMNTKLRSVSTLGLSIGRDHTYTFLNIDSDFFNVKHLHGEGRLTAIDVWGAGGKKSADDQNSTRQWENKQVEKSRKVRIKWSCICMLFSFICRSNDHTKKKKLF